MSVSGIDGVTMLCEECCAPKKKYLDTRAEMTKETDKMREKLSRLQAEFVQAQKAEQLLDDEFVALSSQLKALEVREKEKELAAIETARELKQAQSTHTKLQLMLASLSEDELKF